MSQYGGEITLDFLLGCPVCDRSSTERIEPSTAISTHLEHLVRSSIDAINSRDFSVHSKTWDYFTPGLKVESAHPLYQFPSCIGSNIGIKRHLKALRYIASTNPGLYLQILNVDTRVDEKLNKAVMFVNLEITGNPLVMQGVMILQFQMIGAEWKCAKFAGARGII